MPVPARDRDWTYGYIQIIPQLKTIFKNTEPTSVECALANIWWVFSFHFITDYYGAIPYFKVGEPLKSIPYDSQKSVYMDFLKKLKESITILKASTGANAHGKYGLVYQGSVSKWLKFANTLRLRLAMRISKVKGAINGWQMGGTAQALYEKGVKVSMNQWGITDASAINNYVNSAATPVGTIDFLNSPPVNNYPVKFSADPLMQYKQVAQQKWIALLPDGKEPWANARRCNYPELYPVVHSDNADLPPGILVKRLLYPDLERQTNSKELDAGILLLNGPDKMNTPLWWDKN